MHHTIKALAAVSALTLSLAACERHKDAATSAASTSASTAAPAAPQVDSKPVAFQKIDTVVGTGKTAGVGQNVSVHYTGWLYDPAAPDHHGAQFDSSRERGPFPFRLGTGGVIPGWDQGVVGMRVGGKRTLVVPAALGYGSDGAGPIPPNANLIFDVELLGVE